MTLEFVTEVDQRTLDFLTIILFGPAGVGKTTAAWSAPEPVLVLTSEPPRRTRFARQRHVIGAGRDIREVLIKERDQLQDAYLYARDPANGMEGGTVVFDTVGKSFQVALNHEKGGPKAKASLPNIGDATDWLERHLYAWMELPLNVVLVAHENIVGDGAEIERYPLMSTSKTAFAERVGAAVDVAAYCGVLQGEDGSTQHVAQLMPAGGRHVKDGTDVLANGIEPIGLDLTAWVERFHAAYAKPKPESEGKAPDATDAPQEAAA